MKSKFFKFFETCFYSLFLLISNGFGLVHEVKAFEIPTVKEIQHTVHHSRTFKEYKNQSIDIYSFDATYPYEKLPASRIWV